MSSFLKFSSKLKRYIKFDGNISR